MVHVPGGMFRLGTDDGDSFESPAHEVTVAAVFMDRIEVTPVELGSYANAANPLGLLDMAGNVWE